MFGLKHFLIIPACSLLLPACDLKFQEAQTRVFSEDAIKLTSGPSRKNDPAWSPDGSKVAYSATFNSTEVFTFPLSSDAPTILGFVPREVVAGQFDISPDAIHLVYVRNETAELVLANLQNGATTVLNPDGQNIEAPVWSPVGDQIAFSARGSSNSLSVWTVSVSGGGATEITTLPGDELNPDWSPDGNSIVFESRLDTLSAINTVDLTAFEIEQLTPDSVRNRDPVWSPDGDQIAYTSTRNDTTSVWVYTLSDSQEINITSPLLQANRPAWSSDGSRIAYRTTEGIRISSPAGVLLNTTSIAQPFPVWLPDENTLIQTDVVENAIIGVISLDDSSITEVTRLSQEYSDLTPAWFPDSETLVFSRQFKDTVDFRQTLWLADYPEGIARPMFGPAERPGNERNPAVSPDGTLLVFDDDLSIYLNLVGSQDVINLAPFIGVNLRQPAWSPAGNSFIANNGGRLRIFETDSSLVVSQQLINRGLTDPAWSAAHPVFGENIAGEASGGINLIRPDGSAPRLIINGGRQPSWSPDASWLTYIRQDQVFALKILLLLPE